MRGTDKVGLAEGGGPGDLSGHGKNATDWGGYSPLETRRNASGHRMKVAN